MKRDELLKRVAAEVMIAHFV